MLLFAVAMLPLIARSSDAEKVEQEKVKAIPVLAGAPDRPFDVLGTVSGRVCHRNAFANSVEALLNEAKELKRAAVALGADAVVDASCHKTSGTSFLKNCWQQYQCTGQAVRFK
jgi:hypothetical protein